MGRRRTHHSGSRLASDQIPGQNQNNIRLRPCHSLVVSPPSLSRWHRVYFTL